MRKTPKILPEFSYILRLSVAWMVAFFLLRLGMLWRNSILTGDIPAITLLQSFLVGARFDLTVTSYLVFPLALWLLVPRYGWQYRSVALKLLPWGLALLWSPLVFLGLAEWEFYREFHDRFNQLALEYIKDDPATVATMIWYGFPVIRYTLLWLAATALIAYILKRQLAKLMPSAPSFSRERHLKKVLPVGIVLIAVLIIGARGGITNSKPLRWGDAYFSKHTFANHLALNGIYTLSRTVLEQKRHDLTKFWLNKIPRKETLETTRSLILQPGDHPFAQDIYPLLRYPGSNGRTVTFSTPPRHVVVILMESLSAEFVGALGAPYGATPQFDRIARKGILFDRFFSQGTHTHQGVFATICSFPNLPGFEYLMKHSLAKQPFRSFISLLSEAGFHSIYVYNGDFTWDNQEGFFRNQGMKHFVGRNDYRNPKHKDPTWGVSDEDMFMRGVEEIRRLSDEGPAFAFLQTLSNHAPFDLPSPAPFKDLTGPEHLIPRLNGIRYADWALGKFFDAASKEPWFKDTLFVILGDHGFGYGSLKTPLDLAAFHIPLLLYYPGDPKWAGKRVHTVGSQVDVLPTVMGLMGNRGANQSWGRDLFRVAPGDQGWAVVKPSGNSQIVGFISGDQLLIASPKLAPVTYQYKLNPWDATQVTLSDARMKELSTALYSYIASALDSLFSFRAGVPHKDLVPTAEKAKASR
ncbi:MAG: LTA synthase family protein [Nitrospirota bacterium]